MNSHVPRFVKLNCKPLILTLFCLSISFGLRAEFTIRAADGTLQPDTTVEVYQHDIDERSTHRVLQESATSSGGIELVVPHDPGLFNLKVGSDYEIQIAPDADEIVRISIKGDALAVDGSPGTDQLQAYESFRKDSLKRLVYPPREKIKRAKIDGASDQKIAALTQEEVDGYQAHLRELNDFVIENIGESIALYATSLRWNLDYRAHELAELVDDFAKRRGDIPATTSMKERIQTSLRVAIGSVAPEISANSLDGETLSVSDFRGTYLLVDFWASWCPPCRVENKHYAELVSKLDESSFTILAVNLDTNQALWKQAVKRDRAGWPQVSDLQGWNSPLAAEYGVTALPASFLLDPEGRIIAKNLRGPALDAKLAELGLL